MKKIEIVKRNLEGQGIGFVVQNRVVRKSLADKLKVVGNELHR